MRITKYVVPVALAVGLTACGSSTPSSKAPTHAHVTKASPTTTTSTVPVAVTGQRVLAILAAGNATVQTDKNEPGTTGFAGVAAAFNSAAQQLQAMTYPTDAQADAKILVAILEKLSADVTQAASDQTATILQNVENDESTELADSDALRHDLGLPASSVASGTTSTTSSAAIPTTCSALYAKYGSNPIPGKSLAQAETIMANACTPQALQAAIVTSGSSEAQAAEAVSLTQDTFCPANPGTKLCPSTP